MKIYKFISAVLVLTLLLNACGGSNDEESKEESKEKAEQKDEAEELQDAGKSLMNAFEKMSEGKKHKKAETCEEYLENFEKWADKYIVVLDKVAKDPQNPTILLEMGVLAPELAEWTMEWENMAKCSEDPEFVKEHEAIVKRIEEAADKIEQK